MPSDPFIAALNEWLEVSRRNSMHHFFRFARESGLSMSHFGAMFHILHSGSCGVTDLGEHLGVSSAASSQMLDRLVERDLILRSEDPNDRRGKQIALTEKGRQLLKEGVQARQDWMRDLAETLTPSEKETILAGLTLLNTQIKQLSPQLSLEN